MKPTFQMPSVRVAGNILTVYGEPTALISPCWSSSWSRWMLICRAGLSVALLVCVNQAAADDCLVSKSYLIFLVMQLMQSGCVRAA